MKIIVTLSVCVLYLVPLNISAQFAVPDSTITAPSTYKNQTSKTLTELSMAIKQDAFQKNFYKDKKSFLNKTANSATPKEAAQNLVLLSQYIKPVKYKKDFNLEGFTNNAKNVVTASQANSLIKSFEEGLLPEAFTSIWQLQKNSWAAELK